jgi:hypothetical protein
LQDWLIQGKSAEILGIEVFCADDGTGGEITAAAAERVDLA